MSANTYDVILAGGGVMGCAIATNLLKSDPNLKIAIIEKDPSYQQCSTVLSDGNIRVQFNLRPNIEMSLYGLRALATFAEDMAVGDQRPDTGYRGQGNLFLYEADAVADAQAAMALQQSLGGDVIWLEPADIPRHFPGLEPPPAIAGATLGRQDGSLDPWAVLLAFKNKAISLGADYVHAEVTALQAAKGKMTGVVLADGSALQAGIVVTTTGAWVPSLLQTVGVHIPVQPVRRQVYVIDTPLNPEGAPPSLFFPSGLYIIHEHAGRFMVGKSFPDDPVGIDFHWQRDLFVERLWPEMIEYLPALDRLKVVGGWAGLYAVNTMDGNAILGEWPEIKGLYLANGFSGHGFQHCFAVGRTLADAILGLPPTIDIRVFSPRRILENKPVPENRHRLI